MVDTQPSHAQPNPSASASPAASPREEAQRRYGRALELFNEGAYDAALLEFRRAYELAPSWKILFNIGQVNVQLNDYAKALEAFSRYLQEGGAEVPPARVTEVQGQIERLKSRVATLEISSDVEGAEVTIDDAVVGKTPLDKPVIVNAGRRKVGLSASGRIPQTKVIEVAGGDKLPLKIELPSTQPLPTSSAPSGPATTGLSSSAPPPPPGPSLFWPGLVATGVLGAGAAVTGILSLGATSDHKEKLARFGVTQPELDSSYRKARRLSIATDVLLGATLLTGAASIYLSLRKPSADSTAVGVRLGPGSVALSGSF